jgi:hypothetical protein
MIRRLADRRGRGADRFGRREENLRVTASGVCPTRPETGPKSDHRPSRRSARSPEPPTDAERVRTGARPDAADRVPGRPPGSGTGPTRRWLVTASGSRLPGRTYQPDRSVALGEALKLSLRRRATPHRIRRGGGGRGGAGTGGGLPRLREENVVLSACAVRSLDDGTSRDRSPDLCAAALEHAPPPDTPLPFADSAGRASSRCMTRRILFGSVEERRAPLPRADRSAAARTVPICARHGLRRHPSDPFRGHRVPIDETCSAAHVKASA